MSSESSLNILKQLFKKTKAFVLSTNVFVFLLFFLIAFAFWFAISLNKEYEKIFTVNVKYRNVPSAWVQSADLPMTIDVKIKDKGGVLMQILREGHDTVNIDFNNFPEAAKGRKLSFQTSTAIEKQIMAMTPASSKIIDFYPATVEVEKGDSREVPVALVLETNCAEMYCISGKPLLSPAKIRVSASKERLYAIDSIYTQPIVLNNLSDTTNLEAKLVIPDKYKSTTTSIKVTIPVEMLVDESIKIPVNVINVPSKYKAKCLPDSVTINYSVAKSKTNLIKRHSFTVSVDYNDIISSNASTHYVTITKKPKEATKCKVTPESVWTAFE